MSSFACEIQWKKFIKVPRPNITIKLRIIIRKSSWFQQKLIPTKVDSENSIERTQKFWYI